MPPVTPPESPSTAAMGRGLDVDAAPAVRVAPVEDAPLVTVVIPSYNSAHLIWDTIQSVRRQTIQSIEIFVVDDGSTDDLAAVLGPDLADDPRMRLIRRPNGGVAAARNTGLEAGRGEFVAFVDADDIWHPRFLEELVAALRDNPAAPYAFSYFFRMDMNNRLTGWPMWPVPPRHDLQGMIVLNVVGNGSSAVFRRALVQAAGGFDPSLRDREAQGAEDWKLCVTLAGIAQPELVPQALVGYRHDRLSMSNRNPERQKRAVDAVISDFQKMFPATPARLFADAKVTMNGWLIPAFLARGLWIAALRLAFESYLLHPTWFLNRSLRTLHLMKLRMIWAGLLQWLSGSERVLLPVSTIRDPDGSLPFDWLPLYDRTVEAPPAKERRA